MSANSDNEAKVDEVLREVELRGVGNVTGSGISTGYHVRNLSGSVDLGSLGSPSRAKAPGGYNSTMHGSADPVIFTAEDEFGDFAHADLASDEFDDFVGAPSAISKPSAFTPMPAMSFPSTTRPPPPQNQAFSIYSSASRKKFKRAYTLLRPLLPLVHPSTPPHNLLSLLLPTPPSTSSHSIENHYQGGHSPDSGEVISVSDAVSISHLPTLSRLGNQIPFSSRLCRRVRR
jgi:hypothetical protein